jgi:hypothetical protein
MPLQVRSGGQQPPLSRSQKETLAGQQVPSQQTRVFGQQDPPSQIRSSDLHGPQLPPGPLQPSISSAQQTSLQQTRLSGQQSSPQREVPDSQSQTPLVQLADGHLCPH